jgi:hypothetical protein
MDFESVAPEMREEWRRSEITSLALAMLREAEAHASRAVVTEAQQGGSVYSISRAAGYRLGLEQAIDLLTRNHEKQTR